MKENEIYDIYSLREVSWFPPGIGWLYLVLSIVIFSYFIYSLIKWQKKRKESWQYRARIELKEIGSLEEIDLITLHDFIKKLTIHKFKRIDSAKLTGENLLEFLDKNDPNAFNWSEAAGFLRSLYKKNKRQIKSSEIKDITGALKKWI